MRKRRRQVHDASLAIGVVTRNRLEIVRDTVKALDRLTTLPYALVIADDGSSDGTAQWARSARIPVVTGTRRGCAWNKNRALLYLMTYTGADAILLLEDDTRPTERAWQDEWLAAVQRWSHVNYCYGFDPAEPPPGSGTAEDPYRCDAFGGHCTITSRAALLEVGYLSPRFRGYGWEHVEWTWRFHLRYRDRWGMPHALPCLDCGVASTWPPSSGDAYEIASNEETYTAIRAQINGPYSCDPWCNADERQTLTGEIAQAAGER